MQKKKFLFSNDLSKEAKILGILKVVSKHDSKSEKKAIE